MSKNASRSKLLDYQNAKAANQFQNAPLADRLRPKKQLGQNFLVDQNIVQKIIAACQLNKKETVLEIGPGLGAITPHIAQHVHKMIAVETDQRYYTELKNRLSDTNVELIHADFLKFDLTSLPVNLKVIANLPYHICSVIIAKLLENKEHFTSLYFTVQLELGQRMVAQPSTKDYSAFSVLTQYHTQPRMLFKIKRTSFKPQPKVDSCFIQLNILPTPTYPADAEQLFFEVVRQAFGQRRKTLANALERKISKANLWTILEQLKLKPSVRAEDLSIESFVSLANRMGALRG